MPIFDRNCRVNSFPKTLIFFVITAVILGIFLSIVSFVCTLFNINQLIGLLLGSAFSIGILWFILDQFNNSIFSPRDRYNIKKKKQHS